MKAGAVQAAMRALPVLEPDRALPGRVLLLAPHPDDESLGCGGIIAALCAADRPPLVAVLTDGAGSHPSSPSWPPRRLVRQREAEAAEATALLGLPADRLLFRHLPDTRSPREGESFEQTVAALAEAARADGCDTVLTTWGLDPHCDHESAALIGRAVAERARLCLLFYPVWGWTVAAGAELPCGPPRGWRVDIAPFRAAKQAAIAAHRSQYGGLITDDPNGFVLPPGLLRAFEGRFETLLLP